MFSHRDESADSYFVHLFTATTELLLSPQHYLYVNGHLAVAFSVRTGDKIINSGGHAEVVLSVKRTRGAGLYNPHTVDGDIVVNGIKTSTYTSALAPWLAHTLLAPVRALHALGMTNLLGHLFDHGPGMLARLVLEGEARYSLPQK
jgi:hypothetical protein